MAEEIIKGEFPSVTVFVKLGGILHREDGPATIFKNDGYTGWFLNGVAYDFETWCELLNKSPKEIMLLRLKYS
jgi:hypothetical protein